MLFTQNCTSKVLITYAVCHSHTFGKLKRHGANTEGKYEDMRIGREAIIKKSAKLI